MGKPETQTAHLREELLIGGVRSRPKRKKWRVREARNGGKEGERRCLIGLIYFSDHHNQWLSSLIRTPSIHSLSQYLNTHHFLAVFVFLRELSE